MNNSLKDYQDVLKNYNSTYHALHNQAKEIAELAEETWKFESYERFRELMGEVYKIRFQQYILSVEFCNFFIMGLETASDPETIKELEKIVINLRKTNKRKKRVLVKFDECIERFIQNAQLNNLEEKS